MEDSSKIATQEEIEKTYGKEKEKVPEEEQDCGVKYEKTEVMKIFEETKNEENMAGRPYYLDYEKAKILVNDKWKERIGGIPQGTFLLAVREEKEEFTEALLLRVLRPTKIPAEDEIIAAIVDYYKDNKETAGINSEMDVVSKSFLSYSGLECRVLGTFYEDNEEMIFGSDVENFYSAYHYKVYKLKGNALDYVVNQEVHDFVIGKVRYSSSRQFQKVENDVLVYIDPKDFLGKRTALFGMTRTGKSNTVKKILHATVEISKNYESSNIDDEQHVGQIIFDINGEYANPNEQDQGAIKETIEKIYCKDGEDGIEMVDIWSTHKTEDKPHIKLMRTNFYKDIQGGFGHMKRELAKAAENSGYLETFLSIDLTEPENYNLSMGEKNHDEKNETLIYDRKKAIYQCLLKEAGFTLPIDLTSVKFYGSQKHLSDLPTKVSKSPHIWITFDEAKEWFTDLFNFSATDDGKKALKAFKNDKGYPFIDSDMRAMLVMLTQQSQPNAKPNLNGFLYLQRLRYLHSPDSKEGFEKDIVNNLREGKIQIVDLSQGDPKTQKTYSEKICQEIFDNSISNFTKNEPNNFIQFYFEEAHNLFPKQQDKNLNQIYNRIAKEGAKLKLGLIYATQEASSVSSNILKNTQNWFISHLNNTDETREIEKYYDFADFTNNLRRFSPSEDTGFIRMKLHSNPFVVPVQIDEFKVNSEDSIESEQEE